MAMMLMTATTTLLNSQHFIFDEFDQLSSVNSEDGTIRLRPNPFIRFFTDYTQECIYQG